ncbi:MAG: Gfo/Idh/MocA family protein [Planctomycetota bacterium]
MKDQKGIDRRTFLGTSAAAVASFMIVPRHVLGGPKYKAPSEKLNIAGIGVGGKGGGDVQACSGENLVALCDVDHERAAATFEKFPNAKKYKDFRVMLDEMGDKIDAVTVSTPDHVHFHAAMRAMKMGKHVYVQKPLTHSVWEARQLTEAARKYNVATQMGNQGHSGEGNRLICEWIQAGVIGEVREVHSWTNRPIWPQGIERPKEVHPIPATLDWDLWLGPAPKRPYNKDAYAPFKWRGWWDFGTGALGDMGCHLIDTPFWALKLRYPTSVEACSTKVNSESAPLASMVHYDFPARDDMPPVTMTWYDGGMLPRRPEDLEPELRLGSRNGGVLFIGSKGKLSCGCYGDNPMLIPGSRMKTFKKPEKTIPRSKGHYKDWIEACKGGKPASSSFDYAGPLTETVLLGNLAIRSGKKLQWDGAKMKVTNVPEANQYVRRDYREGWSL